MFNILDSANFMKTDRYHDAPQLGYNQIALFSQTRCVTHAEEYEKMANEHSGQLPNSFE